MKIKSRLGRLITMMAVLAAIAGIGFILSPEGGEPSPSTGDDFLDQVMSLTTGVEAVARRGGAGQGTPSSEKDDGEHELTSLRLLGRAMILVSENYVDPDRIDPKRMLLGSLDHLEKRIPEVLVDDRDAEETGEVLLTVNRSTTTVDVSGMESVLELIPRFRRLFSFIQDNLVSTEDTRRIEYAAINGMLSTLDPHSNLLDPDQYSDMKLHTRGEFGGLGFVVSMRDGRLTVMRIIPNTPAHDGGVKPRDVITRIAGESTANMDLTEAVSRLRGKPGTKIEFFVDRPGEKQQKQFELERSIIEIESIDPARLLADDVGYIRVTNFQGHTTRDLRKAFEKLQEEAEDGMKGLILDLRANPGGLLEQAIQVADLFLDRGTIVSTVGMSNRLRERNTATRRGTLKRVPLVVLVSNTSASASEIVSGAVRYLDRGLVIGNSTFGKGSVQVLYDLVDDSALKLTIAQYLTTDDISIQDLGIVPDIELLPSLVSERRVMVFAPRRSLREVDLEDQGGPDVPTGPAPGLDPFRTKLPSDEGQVENGKEPLESLIFLRDDVPEDEEIDEFEEPEWEEDFHVHFARRILAEAGATTREEMLERSKPVIEASRESERGRIYEAVSELGVDWSSAPEGSELNEVDLEAELSFDGPSMGGEETGLVLSLRNAGEKPLYRVRAWTESASPPVVRYSRLFDRLEFLFGKLEPGETRTWRVPVELPRDLTARREKLDIRVEGDGAGMLANIPAILDVDERPSPVLAFHWQVNDAGQPKGDGRLSVGEDAMLDVFLRNIGEGDASDVVVTVRHLEDKKVNINRGRHRIGELKAGNEGKGRMSLQVDEGFEGDEVRIKVTAYDLESARVVSDQVTVPLSREPIEVAEASGTARLRESTEILAWAGRDAELLARVTLGTVLPVKARVGSFYRVAWGGDREGFVHKDSVRLLTEEIEGPDGDIVAVYSHRPPRIVIAGDRAPVTEQEEFILSGMAEGESSLRDVYIFVNNDKLFFRASRAADLDSDNGNESDGPEESDEPPVTDTRVPFEVSVPLEKGANSIIVFARKNDDLMASRRLVVFRDAPEKP